MLVLRIKARHSSILNCSSKPMRHILTCQEQQEKNCMGLDRQIKMRAGTGCNGRGGAHIPLILM